MIYNCKFILPFAGHFQLWHPNHKKYVPLIGTIKISDVEKTLKDEEVNVCMDNILSSLKKKYNIILR